MASRFSSLESLIRLLAGTKADWRLHRPRWPQIPSIGMHWVGPFVAIISTAVGWFAFKDAIGEEDNVAFALFIGSVSILLMAWSNVLSTRISFVETMFGGLDRMYRWHRWFASISVAAMWLHIQFVDDVKGVRGASKDVADAAEELAGLGEKLLYVLVIASIIRWLPYRWWKQTHKLMIFPYVFAAWHFHTATKPYANSDAWGRWFQILMLIGVAAWIYRVVWCDGIRQGITYRITSVHDAGSFVSLEMMPDKRKMRYEVGQFAFLRLNIPGLREPHPFTIASHPYEDVLRFHIKNLGDWTRAIVERVELDTTVKVEGPYGALKVFSFGPKPTVWFAGGIGITPFLGAVRDKRCRAVIPHLVYSVRSRRDAAELDVLEEAHNEGRIKLHLFVSQEVGRPRRVDIAKALEEVNVEEAHIVMCGPEGFIRDMSSHVNELGARHVHVEGFDIRTGVGPDLSCEIEDSLPVVRENIRQRVEWTR